jgi:hypothetical protein
MTRSSSSSPAPERLRIEPLCGHHRFLDFFSGNKAADYAARQLLQRVLDGGVPDFVAMVAATRAGDVVGIVSAVDIELDDQDNAGKPVKGPAFFYSLLVIDRRHQRTEVLDDLLWEIGRIYKRRLRTHAGHYIGEVAAPPGEHSSLARYLENEKRGFLQLQSDRYFWYRPRNDHDAPCSE